MTEPAQTQATQRAKCAFLRPGAWPAGLSAWVTACTSLISRVRVVPTAERLARIQQSPNYRAGAFTYFIPTGVWIGGHLDYLKQTFFGEAKKRAPDAPLPVVWTDIAQLDVHRDVVVWLGHSSIYLQLNGKRILIDPIFSSYASPVSFIGKAFKGPYPFSAERMPEIDYLLISHDHWDHLDYPTLTALRPKVKAIVTPLGVGAYLERWGYAPGLIHEGDWYDTVALEPGLAIHLLPSRHFSGRMFRRNQTLWAGFLLETAQRKVFYSGDGGYGPHFADIAKRFGPVDLALVENGQYDSHWAHIHLMPEETVQAAIDLQAKMLIPMHAGRFALAHHAWDDPYERTEAASRKQNVPLATPRIGEVVYLDGSRQTFSAWWRMQGVNE